MKESSRLTAVGAGRSAFDAVKVGATAQLAGGPRGRSYFA